MKKKRGKSNLIKIFSSWKLILRSISFYHRSLFLLGLSLALVAMVVTGALIIGDSTRHSLERISQDRLGKIEQAVISRARWFEISIADALNQTFSSLFAPAVFIPGFVSSESNASSISFSLYGVGEDFFRLAPNPPKKEFKLRKGEVCLNQEASEVLQAKIGDSIVVRYFAPSALPSDAPLSKKNKSTVSTRLLVACILEGSQFGNFSMESSQQVPYNIFIDIAELAMRLERPNRANMMLTNYKGNLKNLIKPKLSLADYGLRLEKSGKYLDLTSNQVFMESAIDIAAQKIKVAQKRVLGYFINEIKSGSKTSVYSFAGGVDGHPLAEGLGDHEVVVNQWLADRLELKPGSSLSLTAYILKDDGSLDEGSWNFKVRSIHAMSGTSLAPYMMPRFPGLSDAQSCSEWDLAHYIDLSRIKKDDEKYWKKYRGSPKIFLSLDRAGQIWGSRFGELTLIRFMSGEKELIIKQLLENLDPEKLGYISRNLKHEAEQGVANSVDFGGLFLGLSFFLILSALFLGSLLFSFFLEQREKEFAILEAVGFSHFSIGRQFAVEALLCAALASIIGALGGVLFAKAILVGLNTIWQGAVNTRTLTISVQWSSLLMGSGMTIAIALGSFVLKIKKFVKTTTTSKLQQSTKVERGRSNRHLFLAVFFTVTAFILFILSSLVGEGAAIPFFFGIGFVLLIGTLYLCLWFITSLSSFFVTINLYTLAWRNCARRRGRSMAVVASLASAIFLIFSVSSNRNTEPKNPFQRNSGTGGYVFYMETAAPVGMDLNLPSSKKELKLDRLSSEVEFTSLPSAGGGEASCLNLNRVLMPRVVGVDPELFKGRFAFASSLFFVEKEWEMLNYKFKEKNVIPVVADMEVIIWSLGKKLGEDLEIKSSTGETLTLRFVGGLKPSIFQGKILISKSNFYRLFPENSGTSIFLVSSPIHETKKTQNILVSTFSTFGVHIETAARRLNRFNIVQNTYLSMFLVLGGIALILGCLGLSVLIFRNIHERKSEIFYLWAIGYSDRDLKVIFFYEYFLLFILAVISGLVSTSAALVPVLRSSTGIVPIREMVVILAMLVGFGVLSVSLAVRISLSRSLSLSEFWQKTE